MFAPRNQTRPSLGVRTPEMTSNRVVLPAPFGPMRPQTAPSATARLTPDSALDASETDADVLEGEDGVRAFRVDVVG